MEKIYTEVMNMNDNSTMLQKIKDNGFYIALGIGILAIIALIAVYTTGRDGGAYEENEIDLNQPADYSSINTATDRYNENTVKKEKNGKLKATDPSTTDRTKSNKGDVDNIPDTEASKNLQKKNLQITDKSITGADNGDGSATESNATTENGDTGATENNGKDVSENVGNTADNATEDGKQLPVTADVGELNFGSNKTISWPVKGEVILPFSMETTVYYKTLDQYRTNPGMLITAGSGSTVKNAYLGKVVKVTSDNTYGNLVTIYLGNDYSAVYGQLDTVYVKEGDFIKAGESVGTIGKPTDSFEEEGSHLFFEIMKGDTPVNPMEFME